MTGRVWVVRHAPPLLTGICAGRHDLSVEPPEQAAERVLAALKEAWPTAAARIETSPSLRCAMLATEIGHRVGVVSHPDDRLQELDFGRWEGRSWTDIEREDRARFERWMHDWRNARPPGGETLAELEARVRTWWLERSERVAAPTLVVTHAGVIRALRFIVDGLEWEQAMSEPVEYLAPIFVGG